MAENLVADVEAEAVLAEAEAVCRGSSRSGQVGVGDRATVAVRAVHGVRAVVEAIGAALAAVETLAAAVPEETGR